jgi:hypothetical protein
VNHGVVGERVCVDINVVTGMSLVTGRDLKALAASWTRDEERFSLLEPVELLKHGAEVFSAWHRTRDRCR